LYRTVAEHNIALAVEQQKLSKLWKQTFEKIGGLASKYRLEVGEYGSASWKTSKFRTEIGTRTTGKVDLEIEINRFDRGLYDPKLDQQPQNKDSLWEVLFKFLFYFIFYFWVVNIHFWDKIEFRPRHLPQGKVSHNFTCSAIRTPHI